MYAETERKIALDRCPDGATINHTYKHVLAIVHVHVWVRVNGGIRARFGRRCDGDLLDETLAA